MMRKEAPVLKHAVNKNSKSEESQFALDDHERYAVSAEFVHSA